MEIAETRHANGEGRSERGGQRSNAVRNSLWGDGGGPGESEKERGGLRVTGCATGDRAMEGRGD